jgi:hypothetical protein
MTAGKPAIEAESLDSDTKAPPARQAKMAVPPNTAPGLELDNKGNPIPFDQRTRDDKDRALGKA